ncbi:hypothetical protein IWW52_004482 [Coemansia sp. RSA 2704]|nr:hypothetical protein IWW52_004482 [Coemansia sp. RSA 2704]
MTMGFNYGQGHFFRVSGAALDELQRMVKRTQGEPGLSSYSLLAALFRMAVSQAQMQPREPAGMVARTMAAATSVIARLLSNPDAPHMLLNIVHTYRLLPPTASTYIGNNIYLCPVNICTTQLQHCTDAEMFGRIATQIAQAVDDIDRPLLGEFYDTVSTHPHAYANVSSFMSAQPTGLSVIDERHYRTSSADFGDGGPAWISGLPWHMPNFVAIFASSASADGADIYVSLKEPVVKAMLKNPFFTAHAELLF